MKKNILFIAHSPGLAGAEKSLLELLEGLNRDNYIPIVLIPGNGPFKQRVDELGFENIVYPLPKWISNHERSIKQFFKFSWTIKERIYFIRKLIRHYNIDIVYTNTITCIDGGLAAKLERKPHIWHIREILDGNTGLHPIIPVPLIPPILQYLSETIIVPSYSVKKEWKGEKFRKTIKIIPNGVDLEKFSEGNNANKAGSFHDDLGISREIKIVTLIGYFHEIKGQAEFVESAKIVCDKHNDSVFVMVGDGLENNPYTSQIIKRSIDLGIRNRVFFFGFREDINRIINSSDIVVCASWIESFSRVICEAMAACKPVIATRCGGPEDIVLDGETGFLVEKKNPSNLADATIYLLEEEEKARGMGLNARKRVENHFRLDQYVKKIEKAIEELHQEKL